MVADTTAAVQFSIGRVIGDSIGIYARNFVSFSVLALVIGLLDLLVDIFYVAPAQAAALGQVDFVPIAVGFLVATLTSSLTQATIIYGTLQDLRGSRAGIGDCISRGLASIIPVIVASIIMSVAVGLASLLLIIPGIILTLIWWVYVPVIVVEGKSITDSFGRSRDLTRGHRWAILGLVIIVIVLSVAVGYLITVVSTVVGAGADLTPSILNYVATSLIAAFGAVLVAVGYYYLRVEKEGVDVNQIASVFD